MKVYKMLGHQTNNNVPTFVDSAISSILQGQCET